MNICNDTYLSGDFCAGPYWYGTEFVESNYNNVNLLINSPPLPGPYTEMTVVLAFDSPHAATALEIFAGGNSLNGSISLNATTHTAVFSLTDSPENWSGNIYIGLGTFPGTWRVQRIILHDGDDSACL